MPHSFRNIYPGRWAIAMRMAIPRFAGSASVPSKPQDKKVLAWLLDVENYAALGVSPVLAKN
jgi:hypothetical protein